MGAALFMVACDVTRHFVYRKMHRDMNMVMTCIQHTVQTMMRQPLSQTVGYHRVHVLLSTGLPTTMLLQTTPKKNLTRFVSGTTANMLLTGRFESGVARIGGNH